MFMYTLNYAALTFTCTVCMNVSGLILYIRQLPFFPQTKSSYMYMNDATTIMFTEGIVIFQTQSVNCASVKLATARAFPKMTSYSVDGEQ